MEVNDDRHEAISNGPKGQSGSKTPSSRGHPPLVAIGASAGGLGALQVFFEALPNDTGLSFVVIVHPDPEHEGMMPDLLQKKTGMPVVQVHETVSIEANHVYVFPPDRRLEVTDHALKLSTFDEPRGCRAPIDVFFRSVANVEGDGIGIVLSGGGSDGAVGIKAIKEKRGLVFVQDPEEAEYDAMPRSAIATGCVDRVLRVAEMAAQITELFETASRVPEDPEALTERQKDDLRRILVYLRVHTGHDFSDYKRSTVLRRLKRRMQVSGTNRLASYLQHVQSDGKELQALFKELLIGVTTFFRDPEAFEALRKEVIPRLFEGKETGDPVRVWVAGCATGEEAYSIAMLLREYTDAIRAVPKIQIFASDLDEAALAVAREGRYPLSIEADVSEAQLQRFFDRNGQYYDVKRSLRDLIVFAPHNLLRDPPFSRLDLITCRNVLIYLQRERQRQIFDIFHYALEPRGYLFLGKAEIPEGSDLFQPVRKEHHLYQARERTGDVPHLPTFPRVDAEYPPRVAGEAEPPYKSRSEAGLHIAAIEDYAPPSVLVNDECNVVYLSERAGRYLQPPGGTLTNDITRLVRPELQVELRTALFQAFDHDRSTVARPTQVQFNGHPRTVYLTVCPSRSREGGERLALVIFNEDEEEVVLTASEEVVPDEQTIQRLEEALQHTRNHLQATMERYESSREQLQAQNEELRSMNEEYKSTTEELETSKEELQSVNEELQTVNHELELKLDEVSEAHSDLQNLMASTEIGTLFLDRALQIKRFTPQVADYMNVRESDEGRRISELRHTLYYDEMEQDAQRVLDELEVVEHEVESEEGCWYLIRLRPYRSIDNEIDGVVITFVDITERKRAELALRENREHLKRVLNIDAVGVIFFDETGTLIDANRAFLNMTGYPRGDVEAGRLTWQKMTPPEWVDVSLQQLELLEETDRIGPYEKEYFHKDGTRSWMLFAGANVGDGTIVEYCIDIDDRKRAEAKLREAKEYAETIVDTVREGMLVLDTDLRVLSANASFYERFGVEPAATEGRLVYELGNGQWDIPELRELLEDVLPDNDVFNGYKVTHTFETIGERTMLLNVRRLDDVQRILLAIEDITERERAEAEATEAMFRELFESVPGLYLILKPDDYEIVAGSDAYLNATMTDRAMITGKTLFEVFPADPNDPDPEGVRRMQASLSSVKEKREPDVMAVTRYPIQRPDANDGAFEERWWSPVNTPVFDASGEIDYIIHRIEDVTPVVRKLQAEGEEDVLERLDGADSRLTAEIILRGRELQQAKEQAYGELRESEAQLAQEVEALERLHQMAQRVVAAPTMQQVLDEILSASVELLKADCGSMQLLDPDHQMLEIVAHMGFQQPFLDAFHMIDVDEESACARALRSSQRVMIEDVTQDAAYEPYRPVAEEAGYRAVQSTPLISHEGGTLGILSTYYRQPRMLSAREERLLDLLARQAADLLEHLQAEKELEVRVEQRTKALRESEENYRTLFESIEEGFCIIEVLFDTSDRPVDYRFLEANPTFEKHTGLHDAVGKRMRELEPRHEEHWFETYGRIALTGESERFTNKAEHLGSRWYDVYAFRVGRPEERKVAILFEDISERKHAEEALRRSEAQFRALVDASAQMVWTTDAEGQAVEDSPSWRAYTGQSLKHWHDVVHPDDREQTVARWEEAFTHNTPLESDVRVYHAASDAYRWTHMRAVPLRGEDGTVYGWVGMNIDINRRKRAQAGLQELTQELEERVEQRTEQVRELSSRLTMAEQRERRRVAQILHDDLQQRLFGIQLQMRFLEQQAESGERAALEEKVAEAKAYMQEAIRTTRELSVDLSPPVLKTDSFADALEWLQTQIEKRHGLKVELRTTRAFYIQDEDLWVLVFQVVRELLFNIVKHAEVDHATVKLSEDTDAGPDGEKQLVIEVIDEGRGFDPAVLDAQPGADGSGFGLTAARERLELVGGGMEIDTAPGKGARVRVHVPLRCAPRASESYHNAANSNGDGHDASED